jgi:hypothetical protein
MHSEFPGSRYLYDYLRHIVAIALSVFCLAGALTAQTQKTNLPDPIKFTNKFDMVANAARAALKDMKFDIEREDRQAGVITTRPFEFISGSLTADEVGKVAINRNTVTGHLLKARYSAEVILEIVSPAETLVTVRTSMEALNRDVDGSEQWLPLESLGTYEKRILGKISGLLMGASKDKKREGFWGQSPQPVDQRRSRSPVPPER